MAGGAASKRAGGGTGIGVSAGGFFFSSLTSMSNPAGYDRLKHFYIQKSSLAWRPLAVHFCAVSPQLIHDIWELIKFFFSLLTYLQVTEVGSQEGAIEKTREWEQRIDREEEEQLGNS